MADVPGSFLLNLGDMQAGFTWENEISLQEQTVEHGLHDDLSLPVSFSMGKIPQDQRSGQAPPVVGPRWIPANFRMYHLREKG